MKKLSSVFVALFTSIMLLSSFTAKANVNVPFIQPAAVSYNYSFEPRQYFAPAVYSLTYTNGNDHNSITWNLRLKTATTVFEDYYFDVQYYGYGGGYYGPYTIDVPVAAHQYLGNSQTFSESTVSSGFSYVLDFVYP